MTMPDISTSSYQEDETYKSLQFAGGVLHVVSSLAYFIGVASLAGSVIAFFVAMNNATNTLTAFGTAAIFLGSGLALLVTGLNLSISYEKIDLDIETIERLRQIITLMKRESADADSRSDKLALQLRAIASSASRTAEAVEALAAAVRRPTKPTGTAG